MLRSWDHGTHPPHPLPSASCESAITYIDGDEGVLLYRGYPIEQIAEQGDFLEGIRAIVIDKDRRPVWLHRDIASVPADLVALMRREAEGGDLDLLNWEDKP